jgi:hypothetical protein
MNFSLNIVVACILLSGCASLPPGYKLSKFSYNGKYHNNLIVSRVPDYGDAHPDGCIIMWEMHLSLESSKKGVVAGTVRDVKSLAPLPNAVVKILFKQNESPLSVSSDSVGKFQFDHMAQVRQILVTYVGYRSLVVDFSSTKQFP